MSEEFEESEVVFEEKVGDDVSDGDSNFWLQSRNGRNHTGETRRKKVTRTSSTKSTPMNIPENSPCRRCTESDLDGGDDGEMVPPHVMVGRRVAGKMMPLSVCTGIGRTLKGRDLSRVRNSVLRMTGFLET